MIKLLFVPEQSEDIEATEKIQEKEEKCLNLNLS